uniref:Gag-like protein n=1 Tax=Anopheles atroparvus TaxID=41427 RepID=A0A182IYV8_ANOAO
MAITLEDHRYVGTIKELTATLARVEEERDQLRQEVLSCKLAAEEGKRQCEDLNARLIEIERAQKGNTGHPTKEVQPAEAAPRKEKPLKKAAVETDDGFTVVGRKGKPAKQKPDAAKQKPVSSKKKKEPRPKTRPDALLLKVQEGSSYAAVLKTLKTKQEELKEVGEAAAKIRRSGDNVLLVLTSAGSKGIGQLAECLQTELEGTATVATLRQTSTLVIRDVSEEVDRAEIRDALKEQLQVAVSESEIRLGAIVRGMRKAYLTVNNDIALMLNGLKLRIWWTTGVCGSPYGRDLNDGSIESLRRDDATPPSGR